MTRQADRILAKTMAEPHFDTAVKAGYLEGAIEQAISELERGFTGFALTTLRNAAARYPSVVQGEKDYV